MDVGNGETDGFILGFKVMLGIDVGDCDSK